MKKIVIIGLIFVLVLVGCSSKSGTPDEGSSNEPAVSGDANTLALWVFADPHKRFFEAVKEEFAKTHPDVKVEISLMDGTSLVDRYLIAARAGGEGAPDLIDIEQGQFPKFIRGDIPFEPLNELMKRDSLQDVMAEGRQALYTVDGVEYGVEHAATASALYYRKDVFEAAGIDVPSLKTWDEFTAEALKVTGENTFVFPGGTGNTDGSEFPIFDLLLKQEGGDVVTPDGEVGINTPEAVAVMTRIKEWKEQGIMDTSYPGGPEFWNGFTTGRFLATIGPDWWVNSLADNAPDLKGKWHAVPIPLGGPNSVPTTVWGGTGLAISKFSKNKDLAWEFMKLAQLTPEMSVKRFEIINLYPALLTSLDDPGLQGQSTYTEYFDGQNLGALYAELIADAPRQNQAWWRPLIGEAWDAYMFEYADGKYTPAEFLEKVETKLLELIEAEEARSQTK